MSKRTICDGCGNEIKLWTPNARVIGDVLARTVRITTGNISQEWDLCDPCQDRVAKALAETLPFTPIQTWFDSIRPPKKP